MLVSFKATKIFSDAVFTVIFYACKQKIKLLMLSVELPFCEIFFLRIFGLTVSLNDAVLHTETK